MADYTAIKARQQQAWATGDYAMISHNVVLVSELLCHAVDLRAGQRVLDVATGSGNTAIAAARHWRDVTGIDYVPALLERARERAAAERLPVTFREGDAEHLPFPDGAFDVVLSTFGVMFAPDQEQAARELLRVCRPGGKVGLANWPPDGFTGQGFRITAEYVPPPPGVLSGVGFLINGRYDLIQEVTRHPSVGHGIGGYVYPITPRRIPMSCHPRVTEWTATIQTHLPHLSKPQATV